MEIDVGNGLRYFKDSDGGIFIDVNVGFISDLINAKMNPLEHRIEEMKWKINSLESENNMLRKDVEKHTRYIANLETKINNIIAKEQIYKFYAKED